MTSGRVERGKCQETWYFIQCLRKIRSLLLSFLLGIFYLKCPFSPSSNTTLQSSLYDCQWIPWAYFPWNLSILILKNQPRYMFTVSGGKVRGENCSVVSGVSIFQLSHFPTFFLAELSLQIRRDFPVKTVGSSLM